MVLKAQSAEREEQSAERGGQRAEGGGQKSGKGQWSGVSVQWSERDSGQRSVVSGQGSGGHRAIGLLK